MDQKWSFSSELCRIIHQPVSCTPAGRLVNEWLRKCTGILLSAFLFFILPYQAFRVPKTVKNCFLNEAVLIYPFLPPCHKIIVILTVRINLLGKYHWGLKLHLKLWVCNAMVSVEIYKRKLVLKLTFHCLRIHVLSLILTSPKGIGKLKH